MAGYSTIAASAFQTFFPAKNKECSIEAILQFNRPFPSSSQPPFQSEAKCEVFVMKIIIHIEIRTNYHNKNFALRLALKERLSGTRKWPIYYHLSLHVKNQVI